MPQYRTLNHSFFKIWSPEMAYVLGFFAADGCMIRHKNGGCYIEFHITDKKLLYDIRAVIGSGHKVSERVRSKEWKLGYRLQIGSKEMFSDLSILGFTAKKSRTLKFPQVPDEFLGDFVRGYFDGDGCVYFKEHFAKDRQKIRWVFACRFTSGSKEFLSDLLTLLREREVKGGFILSNKSSYELVLSHHDSLALYGFMYNNRPCSIYLKRKKVIFDKAIRTLEFRR